MITAALLERFLAGARGPALRDGHRYAREARVLDFVGTPESTSTIVRGRTGEFEVALWVEGGEIECRCNCPSRRGSCKHGIAAALVLKQWVERDSKKRRRRGWGNPGKPAHSAGGS